MFPLGKLPIVPRPPTRFCTVKVLAQRASQGHRPTASLSAPRPRMGRGKASHKARARPVPATGLGSFTPSEPPLSDGSLFFRLWYEGLTEEEAYVRFIDSYRLRKDEEYVFTGEICKAYRGANPLPELLEYVQQAKRQQMSSCSWRELPILLALMPLWWNKEHDRKLIETATSHDWADIKYCVEFTDIREHYGELNKPGEHLVLRALAAQIYGKRLVPDDLTKLRAASEKVVEKAYRESMEGESALALSELSSSRSMEDDLVDTRGYEGSAVYFEAVPSEGNVCGTLYIKM